MVQQELRGNANLTARAFAVAYESVKGCEERRSGGTSPTLLGKNSDDVESISDNAASECD